MRKLTEKTPPRRLAAFTLVELLVVIGIIAILVSMISPAIYNVIVRARVTEVKSEIAQIEGAISDFKLKFGMNPPSRITLYESGNRAAQTGWYYNDSSDPVGTAKAKWSRSVIRRLWPDFNFELPRNFNPSINPLNGDVINPLTGDSDTTDQWDLEGDQCLVFFLGGIWDGTKFAGFSADPREPFKLSAASATRIGPFMEFEAERIVTEAVVTYTTPLANFPVYVDTLPGQVRPYMYASSNEGLGYNPADVSTPASEDNFSIYFLKQKAAVADPDPAAWKPETFQIISPGQDGEFGPGGPYMPDQTNPLPPLVVGTSVDRSKERDNITNFSDGTLDP